MTQTIKRYQNPTRTIDLLIKGDSNVVECYRKAVDLWARIEKDSGFFKDNSLINGLDKYIEKFEQLCGNRLLGREIMGIVGVGRYCSERMTVNTPKNRQKAELIYLSLVRSDCSIEVQYAAKHVLKLYGLDAIVDSAYESSRMLSESAEAPVPGCPES